MKKIAIATFVLLTLVGCGKEIDISQKQVRKGIVYTINEDKPFTGKVVGKYENGQNKLVEKFKEGKFDVEQIYYYENGAYPRKPRIVYDRSHTSMSKISIEDFPDTMYSLTRCFHTTGITLALGEQVRTTAYEMIKKFKKNGALISFDVNFRSNLWSGEEARRTIEEILPLVDIFFCSEETARLTFKKSGNLKDMMKEFADEYNIGVIASTQRIVHSPKIHTFGSVIYEKCSDTFYEEPPYSKIEVVDRIGSGDAYISGVLYGILSENGSCAKALSFGNAAGAIKNTIPGDMQASLRGEVEAVIQSHRLKGNDCEMVR